MNILISGASSGIGKGLAIEYAKNHHLLFLCGRDKDRLRGVSDECQALGSCVHSEILDVCDAASVSRWVRQCDAIAPLDLVFANAGVSTGEETEQNVRTTFATNVGGCVNLVLPILELFEKRGRGQIVLTASIAGYGPLKACPSYSATKACIKTWGLALRGMLAARGIKVNVICPGFVRSRITDRNTCPMPFFMEADTAARIIVSRVAHNVGLIAFPWPMRLGSWLLSILPQRLNEGLNRLLPKKTALRA